MVIPQQELEGRTWLNWDAKKCNRTWIRKVFLFFMIRNGIHICAADQTYFRVGDKFLVQKCRPSELSCDYHLASLESSWVWRSFRKIARWRKSWCEQYSIKVFWSLKFMTKFLCLLQQSVLKAYSHLLKVETSRFRSSPTISLASKGTFLYIYKGIQQGRNET